MRVSMIACSLATVVAAACGGDDGVATTTNTAQASSAVSQVGTVTSSIGGSDGAGAAGAVYSLGGVAGSIITPAPQGAGRVLGGIRAATGTCECTASGCTFEACGDEAGTWTLDGTVGISGDTYTFDLDMKINTSGLMWDWAYSGSITATATSLSGDLAGGGNGSITNPNDGSTIDLDWSWSVDYNDIVRDAQGCATGGSLDATVSYDAGTSQGSASYSGSAKVTFGPACGQATAG